MSRLVAVSNRVSMRKPGRSVGGLAVGVLAALDNQGGIWFGRAYDNTVGGTCSTS